MLLALAVPAVAAAQEGPPVIQVFVVEVAAKNVDAYMARLKEAQAITKRLGLRGFRTFQTTAAGPNTGSIIVSVESKSLMEMAQNQGKLQADPGWQAWVEKMQNSDIGRVVSNSLMIERTAETQ
jgi:hypothetical protein